MNTWNIRLKEGKRLRLDVPEVEVGQMTTNGVKLGTTEAKIGPVLDKKQEVSSLKTSNPKNCPELKLEQISMLGGTSDQVTNAGNANEKPVNCNESERKVCPAGKKIQRKDASLKTNQLKPRENPEIRTDKCRPEINLTNSQLKRQYQPEKNPKSPKSGAQKVSPVPDHDIEKVSNRGTKMGTTGTELSS